MKTITRRESDDKFVFSMFDVGADGKDTKTMELTYTRRKQIPGAARASG